MSKLAFSPSQQTGNQYAGGGTGRGDSEEFWMGQLSVLCKKKWDEQKTGIPCVVIDTGTLAGNIAKSNLLGITEHLALHTNAGGVHGTELFAWKSRLGIKSSGGTKLMAALYPFIASASNMPDRGQKWSSGYAELNSTKAFAVIAEFAFHDNAAEAEEIRKSIPEFAEATVKGLCRYYGKTYKTPAPPVVVPPPVVAPPVVPPVITPEPLPEGWAVAGQGTDWIRLEKK